jgi:gamma-butyrobetaine dioxygenase
LGTWPWDEVRDDDEALSEWLAEVVRSGRAILSGVPARPGAVLEVVERFGFVRQTNYGRIFDVRIADDPANLAFSDRALGPHTDNPYRDPAPTLQLLHCLASSLDGGETILVDGFAAADQLRSESPGSYGHLARWPVRWRYGDADTEMTVERPVLELDPQGTLLAVRYNERSRCPSPPRPHTADEHLLALQRFAAVLDRPGLRVRLTLGPGDLVLFDNRRVLHGRTAFSGPDLGRRHLQGCYAERDGLASRLAVLQRRSKLRRREREPSGAAYGSSVKRDAARAGGHRA